MEAVAIEAELGGGTIRNAHQPSCSSQLCVDLFRRKGAVPLSVVHSFKYPVGGEDRSISRSQVARVGVACLAPADVELETLVADRTIRRICQDARPATHTRMAVRRTLWL